MKILKKNQKIKTDRNEYTLIKQRGMGGQAVIWEAVNSRNKKVAIKFLHKGSGDSKIARFMSEVDFQTKTTSMYIAKVLDSRFDEKYKFYVMDLYDQSLRDLMKEGITPTKAIKYFIDICKGLRYSHNKETIHRDLKPENILYDSQNDRVLIADFGIAHFKDSKLTSNSDRMANFNYRAPEQLNKSRIKVSQATDIFSLGLIFNEMFTGEVPVGSSFKKISDVNIVYSIFDNVIEEMLYNDLKKRPQNINEVINLVNLYTENIEDELDNVKYNVRNRVESSGDQKVSEYLLSYAVNDILVANRLLELDYLNWDEIDTNYHMNIRYDTSDFLYNSVIQYEFYKLAESKFRYEGNVYKEGSHYVGLNLEKNEDKEKYDKFFEYISSFDNGDDFVYVKGEMLKMFHSLVNYHCDELYSACLRKEEYIREQFKNAPILHICYHLQEVNQKYKESYNDTIDLSLHIDFNLSRTTTLTENKNLYSKYYYERMDNENVMIDVLVTKFQGLTVKKVDNTFNIMFDKKIVYKRFYDFCSDSYESEKNDNFKYDVIDILRIWKESKKIILLRLSDFDFNNTLRKIMLKSGDVKEVDSKLIPVTEVL